MIDYYEEAKKVYPLVSGSMFLTLSLVLLLVVPILLTKCYDLPMPPLVVTWVSCLGFVVLGIIFFVASWKARMDILDKVFHVKGSLLFRDLVQENDFNQFIRTYRSKFDELEDDTLLRLNATLTKNIRIGSMCGPHTFKPLSGDPVFVNVVKEGVVRLIDNRSGQKLAGAVKGRWIEVRWLRPLTTWKLMKQAGI